MAASTGAAAHRAAGPDGVSAEAADGDRRCVPATARAAHERLPEAAFDRGVYDGARTGTDDVREGRGARQTSGVARSAARVARRSVRPPRRGGATPFGGADA